MGIELELHSEALAKVLSRNSLLRKVDPYGDTIFTDRDAEAALSECAALRETCATATEIAAVDDLATMLRSCAAGNYLWFMGD